jgi:hypothetical protein
MKKSILFFILAFTISTANAQLFSFGIKGGVNDNSNGNMYVLSEFSNDIEVKSDSETGYHFGVFGEINLPIWLYIRPELNYTHTESSYDLGGYKHTLEMNKIEVPVLLGLQILHWGRIFAGPSFSYIMDSDLSGSAAFDDVKSIESDDYGVNGQIGIGVEIMKKFGADLRYEMGFSDTEATFEGDLSGSSSNGEVRIDTDPEQVILSFYYKF